MAVYRNRHLGLAVESACKSLKMRISVVKPRPGLLPRAGGNDFVAYIDAIGGVDGTPCLIEWKTTSARYAEAPDGLLALDPQLVCYSWITGIPQVAQVVFMRKRLVEVQYLRTTITENQRQEFAALLEAPTLAARPRGLPAVVPAGAATRPVALPKMREPDEPAGAPYAATEPRRR